MGAVMPVSHTEQGPVWRRRTTGTQWAVWGCWLVGVAIVVYCWKLISDKTVWFFVLDAGTQAADMASRVVPPKWSYMSVLWRPVWDTINIATLGTLLAVAMAFPIAFLAAVTWRLPPSYIWGGFVIGLSIAAVLLLWRLARISRQVIRQQAP